MIFPRIDGLSFEDQGPFFAKNPDYRKNAIEWGCHCVPIFEKLMIEYCEKFISENPGTLESPIAYGG